MARAKELSSAGIKELDPSRSDKESPILRFPISRLRVYAFTLKPLVVSSVGLVYAQTGAFNEINALENVLVQIDSTIHKFLTILSLESCYFARRIGIFLKIDIDITRSCLFFKLCSYAIARSCRMLGIFRQTTCQKRSNFA